ncbi:molybdopterin-dependent oxidoreductase [Phycicoccus sp. Soil802]|uniref:molybdopterin-dependent oxidoreductase n=1 Tax=Phycicoccus sp. Soil802 TaxID=1736414 RepID=UPI000702F58A|nr:molybdopterin-dependent oxidoreductase [Phycicoccus sp. Soil802]KRF28308.1 oxidoreductase [Phycicoccus sp. Soil802]
MEHHSPPGTNSQRARYAVGGVLAAAAGMAVGHLVAAFVNPAASPVLAVGSTVIDATPTPVKEWAVQSFGTADKPILLGSVTLVVVIAAAAIGLVSRTKPSLANILVVGLASLAGLAAWFRPASAPFDIVPAFATAIVGVLTITGLRALIPNLPTPGAVTRSSSSTAASKGDSRPESPLDHTAYAKGSAGAPARRNFLLGAAGVTVGAATLGALGHKLAVPATDPASIALPQPQNTLEALPSGLEGKVKGITRFRTPIEEFYRVDTALVIPRINVADWKLEIDGKVDNKLTITFDQLLTMPMIEKDITLNCVSNEVGGPYISSARWLGVRVRDLLERAGIQDGVDQILSESTDGMTISTPIEALTDDRDAIIAVAMDGAPLPARHGFPARLVTPGLYGFVGATKWLTRLTATTYAAEQAYWTKRDWLTDGTVKTQARIDTPAGLATQPAGKIAVGGVAWAQRRGITEVEVRVDDGPWQKATLGPDGGTDYWRQWFWVWDATPGRHDLTVRAKDGTGAFQTEQRADPFPGGASGWHSIVVLIS